MLCLEYFCDYLLGITQTRLPAHQREYELNQQKRQKRTWRVRRDMSAYDPKRTLTRSASNARRAMRSRRRPPRQPRCLLGNHPVLPALAIIGEWLPVSYPAGRPCSTEEIRLGFSLLHSLAQPVPCTPDGLACAAPGETIQAKDVPLFARWHRKIGPT